MVSSIANDCGNCQKNGSDLNRVGVVTRMNDNDELPAISNNEKPKYKSFFSCIFTFHSARSECFPAEKQQHSLQMAI